MSFLTAAATEAPILFLSLIGAPSGAPSFIFPDRENGVINPPPFDGLRSVTVLKGNLGLKGSFSFLYLAANTSGFSPGLLLCTPMFFPDIFAALFSPTV